MDIITYGLLNKKKANIDSPHFTGEPTAPTPEVGDDSERIATTEFVQDVVAAKENTKYEISREGEYIILAGTDESISRAKLPFEYGTVSEWAGRAGEVSQQGMFYVYTDYSQDEHGANIPAVKIGDGLAYIGDLPFTKADFLSHINDTTIHVTAEEKEFWNNKVRCYILQENNENLIFTTD